MMQNQIQSDVLLEVVSLLKKTIKGDNELIYHILFNGLSAFTSKPTHLMVMEKSSEGKTYPALEISQYFPKENVITLSSVTPQSFKYEYGVEVDENNNPIEDKIDVFNKQIQKLKKKNPDDSATIIDELESQKKKIQQHSHHLIDLRNKWIIFKEPPDPKLLEALYSTLSQDEEFSEHRFVNKTSGTNQTYKVVLRGSPAILICTAKDETKSQRWDETFTRFNIISPISSPQKYRSGMELISKVYGLPKEIYSEFVISEEEKEKILSLIQNLIDQIQDLNGEIVNPFIDQLSIHFPQEVGYRWRQFRRFLGLVNLHCLCYSRNRPRIIMEDRSIPIVTLADINWALSLMKDNVSIPPNKINWFRDIFLPCWENESILVNINHSEDNERKIIIGQNLKKFIKEKTMLSITVKKIRETYLETLFEHGIIEKYPDPRNKTRDLYWPVEEIKNLEGSSFIITSSLNKSCVNVFIEKYLKRRFSFELHGKKIDDNKVIEYILSNKNVIKTSNLNSKYKMTK